MIAYQRLQDIQRLDHTRMDYILDYYYLNNHIRKISGGHKTKIQSVGKSHFETWLEIFHDCNKIFLWTAIDIFIF